LNEGMIAPVVNESFDELKEFLGSVKNFFESEVFFRQDILRWSIGDICFIDPKKSATKWLRLKNIFTESKLIFAQMRKDMGKVKKWRR